MKSLYVFLSIFLLLGCVGDARAAFIVEARATSTTGLGYGNFSGTHSNSSTSSTAVGLTPNLGSVYGSAVYLQPANYWYSYTPGSDADNWAVPSYQYFGNGLYAPGTPLAGGQTGYYNVYITWPASTNVNAAGCYIYITGDAGTITLGPLDMRTGGTSDMAKALAPDAPAGTIFNGANNAWLRIASDILLTAGTEYTVNQVAIGTDSVSARSSAVMWEFVAPIPEPATLAILGLGAVLVRRFRRS